MRALTICILILVMGNLFGQTPSFREHQKLNIQIDTLVIAQRQLTVTVLISKLPSKNEKLVWLSTPEHETEPRFLGYIDDLNGFYYSNYRRSSDKIILVKTSENQGAIILIQKNNLLEFPGYYYAIQGNNIYTKQAGDGDLRVSHYNWSTGELKTKPWNNINGNDPWNIDVNYNYNNIQWITSH
ncbi:hypothetical protein E1176_19765 [Fulvivirga sp. RKSG066]|uniref:hypothetical protein n=1 Tax=Fulvivirga aurantia TaxID=2529383 RepID=UPI0012BBD8C1|nr:hypothetical protein [Fulvivirga aurantia]MTI23276.1 hypothetical protein [Fulvivirga aurantia]